MMVGLTTVMFGWMITRSAFAIETVLPVVATFRFWITISSPTRMLVACYCEDTGFEHTVRTTTGTPLFGPTLTTSCPMIEVYSSFIS